MAQQKHIRLKDAAEKRKQTFYYNQHHEARPLQLLLPGETVLTKLDRLKEWTTPAAVKAPHLGFYDVEMQK